MPGNEERNLRREKREQKRRTAKHNRASVRKALHDSALGRAWEQIEYDEEVLQEVEIPRWQRVGEIHVGRNAPRRPKRVPRQFEAGEGD
jgi:hypothetical protein